MSRILKAPLLVRLRDDIQQLDELIEAEPALESGGISDMRDDLKEAIETIELLIARQKHFSQGGKTNVRELHRDED